MAWCRISSRVVLGLTVVVMPMSAPAGPGPHGPNGEHLDVPSTAPVGGMARLADGSVNVPKDAQRRLEVRTMMAAVASHPMTLQMNGQVAIDPNAGGLVQAPFAGRIEPAQEGLPMPGQTVRKGQVLAYVRPIAGAIERGNQQAELAELRASRSLAQQRIARLEALAGTVPEKELQAARSELAAITGRERALAGSLGKNEAVTASATGVIAIANVLAGQIVDARAPLFTIVDPKRVVVEALSTNLNITGKITSASLSGLQDAKLTLVGTGRSLRDGALPLTFRATSEKATLVIGQPVTVIARLTDRIQGIALPAEAVVRNPSNQPIVWVKASLERFVSQPVQYRPLGPSTVVVTEGLAPENRVVVRAAGLINQIR